MHMLSRASAVPAEIVFSPAEDHRQQKVWSFLNDFRESAKGRRWTSLPQAFKRAGWHVAGFGKTYQRNSPPSHDCVDFAAGDCKSWSTPHFNPDPSLAEASRRCEDDSYPNTKGAMEHEIHGPGQPWRACGGRPDNLFLDGNTTFTAIDELSRLAQEQRKSVRLGRKAQPFFLAVGLNKPHLPWVFPARFLDKLPPIEGTDLPKHRRHPTGMPSRFAFYQCNRLAMTATEGDASSPRRLPTPLFDQTTPLDAARTQEWRRAYWASVAWVDHLVGMLSAAIDAEDVADNTVVVLMSDHGFQLGEHGEWCKQTNFEVRRWQCDFLSSFNAGVPSFEVFDPHPEVVSSLLHFARPREGLVLGSVDLAFLPPLFFFVLFKSLAPVKADSLGLHTPPSM